ncbi:MAG: hypothetical protein Fur0021_19340 [Candidatus Promineifilaceae bacterium]
MKKATRRLPRNFNPLQGTIDFCTGQAWGLWQNQTGIWQQVNLGLPAHSITAFGQDIQGELYVADAYDGRILKLGYTP